MTKPDNYKSTPPPQTYFRRTPGPAEIKMDDGTGANDTPLDDSTEASDSTPDDSGGD